MRFEKRTFHGTMAPHNVSSTKRENQKSCWTPCVRASAWDPSFLPPDFLQRAGGKVCWNYRAAQRFNQQVWNPCWIPCVLASAWEPSFLHLSRFRDAQHVVRRPSPKNAVHHRPRRGKRHSHFCTNQPRKWHSDSLKTVLATKSDTPGPPHPYSTMSSMFTDAMLPYSTRNSTILYSTIPCSTILNSMMYCSCNALLYDAGLYNSLLCDAVHIGSFSTKLPLMKINQSGYDTGWCS